jgi:hypothetical protein
LIDNKTIAGISTDKKYWILATLWEACQGIGDQAEAARIAKLAKKQKVAGWMFKTTETQIQFMLANQARIGVLINQN